MSPVRQAVAGATRVCPHCRETILESAAVCPACKKHLRFDAKEGAVARTIPGFSPLRVEGTIRHPENAETCEYTVLATLRNERGEEVGRHLIGVGALKPSEFRTFTLSVEVTLPRQRD
jgi:hypothetical protein